MMPKQLLAQKIECWHLRLRTVQITLFSLSGRTIVKRFYQWLNNNRRDFENKGPNELGLLIECGLAVVWINKDIIALIKAQLEPHSKRAVPEPRKGTHSMMLKVLMVGHSKSRNRNPQMAMELMKLKIPYMKILLRCERRRPRLSRRWSLWGINKINDLSMKILKLISSITSFRPTRPRGRSEIFNRKYIEVMEK